MRGSEIHADLLGATWLGLYFLGVPYNEPWEHALRLVERDGGFPHGAMINKSLGDVYRWARRTLPRDYEAEQLQKSSADGSAASEAKPSAGWFHPQGIYVLTRRPFALLPFDEWPAPRSLTHPSFATLGRTYALLQLRLYVGKGLPISYVVPGEMFRHLHFDPKRALTWMSGVVGDRSRVNQHLLVSRDPKKTAGLPTCVLAHNRGVYTLEGMEDFAGTSNALNRGIDSPDELGITFAGNRVGSSLTKAYRDRLTKVDAKRVAWDSPSQLEAQLEKLASELKDRRHHEADQGEDGAANHA